MQVFCDFDGTISAVDTTDHVLERLASPQWEALEAHWRAGRITAAACMRGQVALIKGADADLDAVLDEVELDPEFPAFAAWCAENGVELTIVSDGVDYFIRRLLARYGLATLPVVSNRLAGKAGARQLKQPHAREGCAAGAGVCKCAAAAAGGRASQALVYVGDGRSDFCVSAKADILFAKGELAAYAAGRGQAHHEFNSFREITATLAALTDARRAAAV